MVLPTAACPEALPDLHSKRPSRSKHPRWRITRIRSTPATEIGTVHTPDAASAIEEAIQRYDIRQPWQRERLVARRIR
jgi:1,2-phenylacetyl-CoA epoxidase PaaB subunit